MPLQVPEKPTLSAISRPQRVERINFTLSPNVITPAPFPGLKRPALGSVLNQD